MNGRTHGTVGLVLLLALSACKPDQDDESRDKAPESTVSQVSQTADTRCAADAGLVDIPDVPEASGLAASTRTPGILWTASDNGEPVVYAIDSTGAMRGRIKVTGAKLKDWEALAVGKCLAGTCLYIADIGDNTADRKTITVYRVPEPLPDDSVTGDAQAFHATYPNGPQDAEAMWVTPTREVYLVTKGETGNISVYRFPPSTAENGKTVELERVSKIEGKDAKRSEMITDASLSPDGKWIAMRSKQELVLYHARELMSGRTAESSVIDLRGLKEPQGEGVTFGPNGLIYLAGEGGEKGRPGTLGAMQCQGVSGSS